MYKAILVDDEAPALRFMQAIFQKYAPDFELAASCQSGEEALNYLKSHRADLLVTDISMPGMDGIALALKAREMYPKIRMVIVSGYAEFEYAQGAIQAAVDDYILKPVTIAHMTATLNKIKAKLDASSAEQTPALLSALLSGQSYDKEALARVYGEEKYVFALLRWGNLSSFTDETLTDTAPIALQGVPFLALKGRCGEEQIALMQQPAQPSVFQAAVKAYVAQRQASPTWTIIFSNNPEPFSALPDFIRKAERLMRDAVVIGRRQFLFLSSGKRSADKPHIANATLKKLECFCQNDNKKYIKDMMITLAADWEKRQVPQIQVFGMTQQVIHTVLSVKPSLVRRQDAILKEVIDLFACAANYGDLMAGLYALLFDEGLANDRKMTPEGLYACVMRYIGEKYAEPINVNNVCGDIGISQTYLSRLFRKYGDTSFSAYLTQCRIDAAMKLIGEHPDMRLRDVASCVGYDDSSYFSKVFHQACGLTPSQWAAKIVGEGKEQTEA